MTQAGRSDAAAPAPKADWRELFGEGQAAYSMLVIGGSALHALQVLVIAIVMPTVVADIGGAAFYAWPTLLYTIGAIVGAASVGPIWNLLGPRRGYALSGAVFMLGTVGCAMAPDMASLIVARGVQGFASGTVTGGGMALISTLFAPALRTRIIAANQGIWMVAQLLGPAIGGAFAEIGWWRGSFWCMTPILAGFVALAWAKLPAEFSAEGARERRGFPIGRIALLSAGVFGIAVAGVAGAPAMRAALLAAGIGLMVVTIRFDRRSDAPLYPSGALSVFSPVGLALWILVISGMVQTSVTLFLPLLLQVVHGVTPLFVSFVSIAISFGWTIGTFCVSGWSGRRERVALGIGPMLMIVGLCGITFTATSPMLVVLTLSAVVMGMGVGTHNVHLLARTMAFAEPGEERITASALPAFRSMGTATGAAVAGMLANVAGLGSATEPDAVASAVSTVYLAALAPLACAALFMFMLLARGDPAPVSDSPGPGNSASVRPSAR